MNRVKANIYVAAWILCLVDSWAVAQTTGSAILSTGTNDGTLAGGEGAEWSMKFSSDYTAIAPGEINFNNVKGLSGAQSAETEVSSVANLKEGVFIPLGLALRNIFLGPDARAPIPSQILTLDLNAGLGYHANDQWTIAGTLGPRFYRLDSVDSSGIGIGHSVWASYQANPHLKFMFGVAVEPARDVPVLPVGGLCWDIATNMTLKLMFPKSRFDYQFSPSLKLFASFDGNFNVFQADNNLGDKTGMSQFNNGLATYRDFLLGAGAEYRIARGLSASIKAGCSVGRELDYQRIDQTVRFGSAPFVQAGLKWRF